MDKKQDKLVEAHFAGIKRADECTLIVVEGDSALKFATTGLSVIGKDCYGIFPLTGKFINARKSKKQKVMDNADVQCLMSTLGLEFKKVYKDVKSLRYDHLMIMTDQDHDGSHIKGLVINFIHFFWPSLLKIPNFLMDFVTPIVKATATNNDGKVLHFYNMPEYRSWKERLGVDEKTWNIRYYKGLASHSLDETKKYFQNLKTHLRYFAWHDETDSIAIDRAFCKNVEQRKNWLKIFEPGTFLDHNVRFIRYKDFVEKELMRYFVSHLQRSIASMVDGLSPAQRKVLYTAFHDDKFQNLTDISDFVSDIAKLTQYKHGISSLYKTIVGMVQESVGTNNINLLETEGQIGTSAKPSADRYISTKLSVIARAIFLKDDDILLDHRNDGNTIEPTWFVPVIPMVLVNGCRGTGVGWSTSIPNYNANQLCAIATHFMKTGDPTDAIHPWYRGFQGTIVRNKAKYTTNGTVEYILGELAVRITQLPLNKSYKKYKKILQKLSSPTTTSTSTNCKKRRREKSQFVENYKEDIVEDTVQFKVTLSKDNMSLALSLGKNWLIKKLKLTSSINMDNMHLFDPDGVIKKYDKPEQILDQFFQLRLQLYTERKEILLANLQLEQLTLEYLQRFIDDIMGSDAIFEKDQIHADLDKRGLLWFFQKTKKHNGEPSQATFDSKQFEKFHTELTSSMGLNFLKKCGFNLDLKMQELLDKKKELENISPIKLWEDDLANLEQKLKELNKDVVVMNDVMNEADMTVEEGASLFKYSVDIENQYYNSKDLVETDPQRALTGFYKVVRMEPEKSNWSMEPEKATWGFKALKQTVKLCYKLGKFTEMMIAYREILTYIKSPVTRIYSERCIRKIMDFVSGTASQNINFLQEFNQTTLEALEEAKNERFWFKTNLKFCKIWFDMGEYGRMNKILKGLHKSCRKEDGTDDQKKGTQLLEVYEIEIQMYTETKNNKKLKQLYQKALTIKSAIPHRRIMGIIHECGGKMHMAERQWAEAATDFFEAFKNYDEAGNQRRIQCLKYLVLANMLMESEVNPFDGQEAKPYKNDPEMLAMTNLVAAYQRNDIMEFEKILKCNWRKIMDDLFIRNYIEDLLKNIRTQELLKLIKPYTRIRIPFISKELNVPEMDVEHLLSSLILDNRVQGHIDQVNRLLERGDRSKGMKKFASIEKWNTQLRSLYQTAVNRVG